RAPEHAVLSLGPIGVALAVLLLLVAMAFDRQLIVLDVDAHVLALDTGQICPHDELSVPLEDLELRQPAPRAAALHLDPRPPAAERDFVEHPVHLLGEPPDERERARRALRQPRLATAVLAALDAPRFAASALPPGLGLLLLLLRHAGRSPSAS